MAAAPDHSRAMSVPDLRVERYQIQAQLGRGGMGAVYRAVDEVTGRVVALKVLEARSAEEIALFEREYRTLASLEHPRMIQVLDYGIADNGSRYYTMELLEGEDLHALSPVPWRTLCGYIRDVATSLLMLHARGLVHRDVSPRNIRLDRSGRAKLLDFGAVSAFGVASDIVGTPVCAAPEVLHVEQLDARTDLYSLGAAAYWALTKRKPYPISEFADAESAWAIPPAPPSHWVPELPKALDALVLSLLSVDPSGRPASAAEVVDRLGAIASIDDQALTGVAESHLLSCQLVGRQRESEQLQQHVERSLRGMGAVVVIEGAAGSGRTRLAKELGTHARMSGMTAVSVDAELRRDPCGVLVALSLALLDALPVTAQRCLAVHAPVLRLLDTSERREPGREQASPVELFESAEARAQLQSAFVAWVLDIARTRPLLLVVDDAHLADPVSAGALVGLAHAVRRSQIVLLVTLAGSGPSPVSAQQLIRIGARLKLRALSSAAVDQLLASIVSDVPHRTRLGKWLHQISGGNPGQVIDLLRDLISRGIIRFENGSWVLPASLSGVALPGSVTEVLSRRLAQLSPDALRLAQLLGLHRGVVPQALCWRLLPHCSEAELERVLEELVAHAILVRSDTQLHFAQEPLRPLLLGRIAAPELAERHRALAKALLGSLSVADAAGASIRELCDAVQAGWHLLQAGEHSRGRELLRLAGIELALRGHGFVETVPALEAALQIYRETGRSRYECAHLLTPLTLAGIWLDWRLGYRYGEELLEIAVEATGMSLAAKLARVLPKRLALALALMIAFFRQRLGPSGQVARSFRESLLLLIGIGSAMIGTCAPAVDHARTQRFLGMLRPLSWFPARSPVRIVHQLQLAIAACTDARYSECRQRAYAVLDQLHGSTPLPGVTESARQQLELGAYLLLGSVNCYRFDGSVHAILRALDAKGTAAARETAAGIRVNYHAGRGEHAKTEQNREEMDVLAAQGGSSWRQDLLVPRGLWWAYALCEDVIGLKRMVNRLQSASADHPGIVSAYHGAHACYLAERGMAAEALERYGAFFEAAVREVSAPGMRLVSAYARILRATGQGARAKAVCETALNTLSPADLEFECFSYSARLDLALATAELGDTDAALNTLNELLQSGRAHDNPLFNGLTHKAIARVALMRRDSASFSAQLQAMTSWFERTDNPALMAQCQRLYAEGRAAGLITDNPEEQLSSAENAESIKVAAAFSACRGPAERLQTALDLVVQYTGAAHGYLYLLEPDGLRFAAPAVGFEPPEELLIALRDRLHELSNQEVATELVSTAPSASSRVLPRRELDLLPVTDSSGAVIRALPLTTLRGGELVVVGVLALALAQGECVIEPPDSLFMNAIARGLYDAGDVQTVYLKSPDAQG